MRVPSRRPANPHSSMRSRSPRRQRLAPTPSTVTRANSATNTAVATQSMDVPLLPTTFAMVLPDGERFWSHSEIHERRHKCANDNPQKLVPEEEWNAPQVRLDPVEEWYAQNDDERGEQQDKPPLVLSAVTSLLQHEINSCPRHRRLFTRRRPPFGR